MAFLEMILGWKRVTPPRKAGNMPVPALFVEGKTVSWFGQTRDLQAGIGVGVTESP